MAACMRLSKFAGSHCLKLTIGRSSFASLSFKAALSSKKTSAHNLFAHLRAPAFYRYNATTAAAATSIDTHAIPSQRAKSDAQNKGIESADTVTGLLSALDDQVRRTDRVEMYKVEHVLDLIVKGGTATTQQGVMLLHCAGSLLVASTPGERIVLCDAICETLRKVGVEFNIQMYNALLKARLENGHAFSPVDMLTEIEVTKQLVPNRVTYQLLLAQLCEQGQLDGASKVLEHMKSQEIPLNENVLNALVRGHVVIGDITGAKEVMVNMGKAGLDSTGTTYTVLMCGLAEKGDLAGIQQIINEVDANEVYISPSNMYRVILTLADKGHEQHIPQIADAIRARFRPGKFNHATLNCVYQLVTGGHDDAAFIVFSMLDFRSGYADTDGTIRISHNLLRCMIVRGRPIEKILEIYEKLKSENLAGEDSLEFIASVALKFQRAEYAMNVVKKVKELGIVIPPHMFWHMLNSEAKHSSLDGVLKVIRQISTADNGISVGAVYRWGIRDLLRSGQKIETVLEKLKENGFNDVELQILHTTSLVSTGNFAEASKLITEGTRHSLAILKTEVVNGFINSNCDIDGLATLLQSLKSHHGAGSMSDLQNNFLVGLIKQRRITLDVIQDLIDSWNEHGIKLSSNNRVLLRSELQARNAPDKLLKKLDQLFIYGSKVEEKAIGTYSVETLKNASLEELIAWTEKAKAENRPTHQLEKWLLHKCCFVGNVEQAEAVKESLINRGFTFREESLRQLGVLAARHKQNLDEALYYKNELESRYPSFGGYVNLVILIAQLQLVKGNFEETITTLKDYATRHSGLLREQGYADGYQLSDAVASLVQNCCEHNDAERSIELLNLLFDSGYVKPGTFNALNQFVGGYVNRSDSNEALKALEHCITQYSKAPQYSSVFRLLIAKEEAGLLQKAVDLVTTIEGELPVLLNLAACFVECGKVKQARKILETPGIRAKMITLKDACQRFISQGKDKELEQFVEITKTLPGVQRGQMLLQLVRLHARKRDGKKIMEAFSLFEEEHIQPDRGVLSYVAKVLQELKLPVPFEIPQQEPKLSVDEGDVMADKQVSSPPNTELDQTTSTDAADLLELRAKLSGAKFSDFLSNSVNKMLKRNETEALRRLIYQLSQVGDVDNLLVVQKLLPKSLDVYIHQQLLIAHIHQNTANTVLSSLDSNILDVRKYLSIGALKLMAEKNSDDFARLEKLATDCVRQHNNAVVLGYLYSYYVLQNQWDSVKQLLQEFSSLKSRVKQAYVCRIATYRKQEDTLKQIIELHKADDKRALITPYSNLLLLKCEQGNWSDAIQCYDAAVRDGLLFDDFWVRSLQALQSLALASKQQVPWQAGALERRAANDAELRQKRRFANKAVAALSSSSSSDSSDSDTEESSKQRK